MMLNDQKWNNMIKRPKKHVVFSKCECMKLSIELAHQTITNRMENALNWNNNLIWICFVLFLLFYLLFFELLFLWNHQSNTSLSAVCVYGSFGLSVSLQPPLPPLLLPLHAQESQSRSELKLPCREPYWSLLSLVAAWWPPCIWLLLLLLWFKFEWLLLKLWFCWVNCVPRSDECKSNGESSKGGPGPGPGPYIHSIHTDIQLCKTLHLIRRMHI